MLNNEKPKKKRGPKKKSVTASVMLRFRATPAQADKYKMASKIVNKNLSQFIIDTLENECKKIYKD